MVKAKNLETQAYQYIKNKITSRQWLPQTHITELDLSKELGISRTPIRRAFIRLQEENILKIIPHKGATIQEPLIDNKGFQYRLGFMELMLNDYLHQMQIREVSFTKEDLLDYVEKMSSLTGRNQGDEFYEAEIYYWQEFVRHAKNSYNVSVLMDTFRSLNQQDNKEIQAVLLECRKIKIRHLKRLAEYVADSKYAYARKEVRILMNQLSLALLQGV